MPLFDIDSISSLSCFSNSFFQPQLLRNAASGNSTPQFSPSPRLLRQPQCTANNSPEVSKAVIRLKKQGIQVTPKILHRVKKNEAWKNNRRVWKERRKAERVTDPVWYDWPEEQVSLDKRRIIIAQSEEDEADHFLSFVDEACPIKRIVVQDDDDNTSIHASKRASSSQKRHTNVQEPRNLITAGSEISYAFPGYGQAMCQPISIYKQSVTQSSGLNCMPPTGGVLLPQGSASEVFYPWRDSHVSIEIKASQELPEQNPDSAKQANNSKLIGKTHNSTTNASDHSDIKTLDFYCQRMSEHLEGRNHVSAQSEDAYGCNEREPSLSEKNATPQGAIKHNLKYKLLSTDEDLFQPKSIPNSSSLYVLNGKDRHAYEANCLDPILDSDTNNIIYSQASTNIAASKFPTFRLEATGEQDTMSGTLQSFDMKSSPALRELYDSNKESPTEGVEKFLDEEIQEAPKKREIWMNGVGIVKQRRPPFSREVKEKILGVRRGDLSVFDEEGDSEDDLSAPSFPFDGRAALVEDRKIQRLAARLHDINYWTSKVHFSRLMHSGRMKLTEDRIVRVVQILGEKGNWRRAMQVVQWVHKRQHYQFHASKFVLTTLLAVLGKARRPVEALNVFNVMRENFCSYPDMAAYHAIATILGQAGRLRELLQLMESLKVGPPKPIKFIYTINWNPSLYPDIVVYNAVLTACIATKEWAGVFWTWEDFEKIGIKPNGATFGLTIEAMVKADEFDQVIRFYRRMERAGFPPNAQTYRCLVEAFGKEKMTEEALELVKEMEASGIVGSASVYFALACSFCVAGKLKEALVQVRRINELPSRKPDVVTYTGLIRACHKVGRIQDAIFLFNHMQHTCVPNVRTCNEMLKIYGWNNMFNEAKEIYEGVKKGKLDSCVHFNKATRLSCDSFTYELMLKAAVVSEQWSYFDAVYWDMTSQGYFLCGQTNQWLLLKVARERKVNVAADMLHRLRKSGEVAHLRFYEALLLSCVQAKRFHTALVYLNDMRIDGYEALPVIQYLQEQVGKETWDSFLHEASASPVYCIFHEHLCDWIFPQAYFSKTGVEGSCKARSKRARLRGSGGKRCIL